MNVVSGEICSVVQDQVPSLIACPKRCGTVEIAPEMGLQQLKLDVFACGQGAPRLIRELSSALINCKHFLVDFLGIRCSTTSQIALGLNFGHHSCNEVFVFTCNTSPIYVWYLHVWLLRQCFSVRLRRWWAWTAGFNNGFLEYLLQHVLKALENCPHFQNTKPQKFPQKSVKDTWSYLCGWGEDCQRHAEEINATCTWWATLRLGGWCHYSIWMQTWVSRHIMRANQCHRTSLPCKWPAFSPVC